MKYFKDSVTSEVFAFESDGSQDDYIRPELVLMTAQEVSEHLNPSPLPPTRESVTALRRAAYADPLTGSDPLYIEYQRELATNEDAAIIEASKSAWLARAAEIAAQYPWPE